MVQPGRRCDPETAAMMIVAQAQLAVLRAQLRYAASEGFPPLEVAAIHAALDQLQATLAEAGQLLHAVDGSRDRGLHAG
ncbi:hypothetical protein KRMM14A1259_00470 [Krasilnikovia sp. MM14-A1259]